MIRRPTCTGGLNAPEPKFSQIEGRNEGVDHAKRIIICNPVIQAFRQQSRLPAISPLNEARHAQPPPIQCGNHTRHGVFTQPGSQAAELGPRCKLQVCPCEPKCSDIPPREAMGQQATSRPSRSFSFAAIGASSSMRKRTNL